MRVHKLSSSGHGAKSRWTSTVRSWVLVGAASLLTASTGPVFAAPEEFDEAIVIVEINATDGDIGFHALADADAWHFMKLTGPGNKKLLTMKARSNLMQQGLTENFFESAEPLCEPDDEEPDERVVTLAEFVERFPAGMYRFVAVNIDGGLFVSDRELTYDLPAAPDISMTEDMIFPVDAVVIMWEAGTDLGEACHDENLVLNGIISDPATVPLVGWEVVVEVDDDEAPHRVFSAQMPPEQSFVTVPENFLQPFVDLGYTEFKFEVGAIEASGNRTFSEGSFEVE